MRHNSYLYGRPGDKLYYAEHKPHARLTQGTVQHDIGPQMCARYSLSKEQITMLIGEIEVIINIGARYNIAPTQIVPAIVRKGFSPRLTSISIVALTVQEILDEHIAKKLM